MNMEFSENDVKNMNKVVSRYPKVFSDDVIEHLFSSHLVRKKVFCYRDSYPKNAQTVSDKFGDRLEEIIDILDRLFRIQLARASKAVNINEEEIINQSILEWLRKTDKILNKSPFQLITDGNILLVTNMAEELLKDEMLR